MRLRASARRPTDSRDSVRWPQGNWTRQNTAGLCGPQPGQCRRGSLESRPGRPLRGLLRLRRQVHLEGVGKSRGQRQRLDAGERDHRIPRTHAGAAERLQRVDGLRLGRSVIWSTVAPSPRHPPWPPPGAVPSSGRRPRSSMAGGVVYEAGRVQDVGGLLPRLDFGSLRSDPRTFKLSDAEVAKHSSPRESRVRPTSPSSVSSPTTSRP